MGNYFTRSEAAKMLGVSRRTLYAWLANFPKSEKLTQQQIEQLAQEHNRAVSGVSAQEQIAALGALVEELIGRVEKAEQRIEALESRPPPRPAAPLDRSASIDATRPTSAPRPASTSADLAPRSSAPGASVPGGSLPPPVRALVAAWVAEHGGPAKDTVRRWHDMPLEPAAALRFTQGKIAELGYRAHGAQLHRCENAQCVCYQVLSE